MLHLATFVDLREFVRQVLCIRANVDFETPLVDSALLRQGRPCGIEFVLLGPQSLRLSAIWEAFGDRILFYDQQLERFQVTRVRGPDVAMIPLRPRQDVPTKSVWKGK